MRLKRWISYVVIVLSVYAAGLLSGCEAALEPKLTPNRVVIYFLKEVGRGNLQAAGEWVVPESKGQIENWSRQLFFPEISDPPTAADEEKIDRFIGLFYRITTREQTEIEAKVHTVFSATDAIIGFPSVSEDPLTPNSAAFMLTLTRSVSGEGGEVEYGDWLIASFESSMEAR